MSGFVRFGNVSLDVSEQRFDFEDRTAQCFAVAKAWLADTYAGCTYHRQRWARGGVSPDDIRSFADLKRLPVMGPEDVQDASEFSLLPDRYREKIKTGLHVFPLEERIWRRFTSTGSTGQPKA